MKNREVPARGAPLPIDPAALSEDELLLRIDRDRLPQHIAVIMDGNRRWARQHGLPPFMGHKRGVKTFRMILESSLELGISTLSAYAFSVDNWKRSEKEIEILIRIFEYYARREKENLRKKGVRFRAVGNIAAMPSHLRKELARTEEYTREGRACNLNLCVNYGSRHEILNAVQELVGKAAEGLLQPEDITEELFSAHLYTRETIDPDLLIRTSGEERLSNFFLWQCAYTEFWFTPVLWPDFTRKDFFQAIYDFQQRERRFGGSGT